MEFALMTDDAEKVFELVNMVVALIAGAGALVLITMVKGEMGKAWRIIGAGVTAFALSELVGGLEVITGSEVMLGIPVNLLYYGIQTIFIALVAAGLIMQNGMFAKLEKGV